MLSNNSNAGNDLRLLSIRVQSALNGTVVPFGFGMNRVSGRLLWSGNFTSRATGGKSAKTSNKTGSASSYDYRTDLIVALCSGYTVDINGNVQTCQGIGRVWMNALEYATSTPAEIPTVISDGAGGGVVTPTQAALLMHVFGVGLLTPYSVTHNDYGSPGSMTRTGSQPFALARITSGSPTAGQFKVNTDGSIALSASLIGQQVVVVYNYYITPGQAVSGSPIGSLSLEFHNGAFGQDPWSGLPAANALGYSGTSYVAATQFDLGNSGTLGNLSVEMIFPLCQQTTVNGNPIIGATPVNVINGVLVDPEQGSDFGIQFIGDQTQASNWCLANSILISPVMDSQKKAADWLKEFFTLANSAPVWSDAVLKFRPYGDTTAVGNGVTFTPQTSPVYDLDDSDVLTSSKPGNAGADDPIQVSRKPQMDADNFIEVQWEDRLNAYNAETWPAKAQWAINRFGVRRPGVQSLTGITDQTVAAQMANIALKNSLWKRETDKFKLPWYYILLEPMDMVTLTSGYQGFAEAPLRITDIAEDDTYELEITAENFPWGTATATIYPKQTRGGYGPGYFSASGSVNPPLFIEAPKELTQDAGFTILIPLSGGANWGGANVWISRDGGTTYTPATQVLGASPTGFLSAAFGSHPDPDTSTLSVDVTESLSELPNYAQTDADLFVSLIAVDQELMAYSTSTLAGGGNGFQYHLTTYIRRGVYGTTINPHLSAARFAAITGAEAQVPFQPGDIGTTLWFKFTSFNKAGMLEEDLADVSAYPFYVTGNASRAPFGLNGGNVVPTYADPIQSVAVVNIVPSSITATDGSVNPGIEIDPVLPPSSFSELIAGVVLNPTVTPSTTGGLIAGGQTLFFAIAAWDVDSDSTDLSNLVEVDIPATTNTNSIPLVCESFDAASDSFVIYFGNSQQNLRSLYRAGIGTGTVADLLVTGGVLTITLKSLVTPTGLSYGMPDKVFDHAVGVTKAVNLPGSFNATVSGVTSAGHTVTVTVVGPTFTAHALMNRVLSWVQQGVANPVPVQDYTITDNTTNSITVTLPTTTPSSWAGPSPQFLNGDVVVVLLQPDVYTGGTIGDSLLSMTPDEFDGHVLRVFYADGTNQTSFIVTHDATTFTTQSPFNRGTPKYFWVEDPSFGNPQEMNSADVSAYRSSSVSNFVVGIQNLPGFYAVLVLSSDDTGINTSLPDYSPCRLFYFAGDPGTGGGSGSYQAEF
jgi:hypothetical protein